MQLIVQLRQHAIVTGGGAEALDPHYARCRDDDWLAGTPAVRTGAAAVRHAVVAPSLCGIKYLVNDGDGVDRQQAARAARTLDYVICVRDSVYRILSPARAPIAARPRIAWTSASGFRRRLQFCERIKHAGTADDRDSIRDAAIH